MTALNAWEAPKANAVILALRAEGRSLPDDLICAIARLSADREAADLYASRLAHASSKDREYDARQLRAAMDRYADHARSLKELTSPRDGRSEDDRAALLRALEAAGLRAESWESGVGSEAATRLTAALLPATRATERPPYAWSGRGGERLITGQRDDYPFPLPTRLPGGAVTPAPANAPDIWGP